MPSAMLSSKTALLVALSFVTAACNHATPETAPTPATPTVTAPAAAAPPTSAGSSAAPPPSGPPAKQAASGSYKYGDKVVLDGIFNPLEEDARGEQDPTLCGDPLMLAKPITVANDKGEAEYTALKRVCVWDWLGHGPHAKEPHPLMLQRNAHVTIRGELEPPMRPQHPKTVLVFSADVVGASPPDASGDALAPDGQSFAWVRKVDPDTRTLTLDVASLYYGEDAKRVAAAKGAKLPADQRWFVVNDSPKTQTIALPKNVYPVRLRYENGGGWRSVPLADLAKEAASGADVPAVFITLKKGQVSSSPANGQIGALYLVNL